MKPVIEKSELMPEARASYPFRDMEVGDSFSVRPNKGNSLRSAAAFYNREGGKRFTVRQELGGYRCWRVE